MIITTIVIIPVIEDVNSNNVTNSDNSSNNKIHKKNSSNHSYNRKYSRNSYVILIMTIVVNNGYMGSCQKYDSFFGYLKK